MLFLVPEGHLLQPFPFNNARNSGRKTKEVDKGVGVGEMTGRGERREFEKEGSLHYRHSKLLTSFPLLSIIRIFEKKKKKNGKEKKKKKKKKRTAAKARENDGVFFAFHRQTIISY
ncbi:hypothetical protein CEXT_381181 [Caerostris extrusa]|uniref:Uncharacterized protein n=1 Tax=Caerostris extrusa TaxID=172846 RepID=A0AAV4TUT8_CAEEX|nr:hypothetical protein CEXT_381181 [Caerostris extrusa]